MRAAMSIKKFKDELRRMDTCSGVSEVIGTVLLITLVVTAVGLVATILFSQNTPAEVPSLSFMTGVNSSKTTLYLYHNSGDPLGLGSFGVLLDGIPASSFTVASGGTEWSLGTALIVPITIVPKNVQIAYNGTGSTGGCCSGKRRRISLVL